MEICKNCFRRHWRAKIDKHTGLQIKHKNGNLVYICIVCGTAQEEDNALIMPAAARPMANILYIDTEISKSIYYNYGAKVPSKYLGVQNLIQKWYMIGWAASYVGNDTVWSQFVSPKESLHADDSQIAGKLHGLMNAAEIIAGHNVDGFDIKKCNTLFKFQGLPPIVGKKTIDTLKLARSKYSFESNGLDYISKVLGFSGKDDITNEDWINAMKGSRPTLDKIKKYCIGDIQNGKKVLMEILPIANKKFDFGAIKK